MSTLSSRADGAGRTRCWPASSTINAGLGPAVSTRTGLTLDGQPLGEFSESSANELRSNLSVRSVAVTFRRTLLAAGYDQFLLSIDPFDRTEHAEFADLLRHRLGLEIHYESLYGGEPPNSPSLDTPSVRC